MKYHVKFTAQFKKDLKLAKKQNKDLDKLFELFDVLANGGVLDEKYHRRLLLLYSPLSLYLFTPA